MHLSSFKNFNHPVLLNQFPPAQQVIDRILAKLFDERNALHGLMPFDKQNNLFIALPVPSLHHILDSKDMLAFPMDTLKGKPEKGAGAAPLGQVDSVVLSLLAAFHLKRSVWLLFDAHSVRNMNCNKTVSLLGNRRP